jgi:hypothetical protein
MIIRKKLFTGPVGSPDDVLPPGRACFGEDPDIDTGVEV